MIKLIASDLDGTLLLHGAQSLNPEIYDIIRSLKKKGIHFVAASGRQIHSQLRLFEPVADQISYLSENGGVCIHGGQVIGIFPTEKELIFRILHEIKKMSDIMPVLSSHDACYVEKGHDYLVNHMRHDLGNHVIEVNDFAEVTVPIVKTAFWDPSGTYQHADHFKNLFSHEIRVMTAGNGWVDFMPFETSKASSLRVLLEKLGISPEEVIAFGDQENDVEMLSLAGKSYAMSSAVPATKAVADEITDSVEDTLKKLLETL